MEAEAPAVNLDRLLDVIATLGPLAVVVIATVALIWSSR